MTEVVKQWLTNNGWDAIMKKEKKSYDELMKDLYLLDDKSQDLIHLLNAHKELLTQIEKIKSEKTFFVADLNELELDNLEYVEIYLDNRNDTTNIGFGISDFDIQEAEKILLKNYEDDKWNWVDKSYEDLMNNFFISADDEVMSFAKESKEKLQEEFPDEDFLLTYFCVFDLKFFDFFVQDYDSYINELESLLDKLDDLDWY